ncbi:MAG: small, acid-soluble spore protein, alpha/beta type [Lachnospiraceae bacterium]
MPKKENSKIQLDELTPRDKMKLEIAKEIGVFDKVMEQGWRSLSAKESGKIGGMLTSRLKQMKKNEKD